MECHRSQITLPLWRMRSTAGGVDEFRRAMCPTHRTAGGYCRFCGSPVGIWPRCDWLIAWNADIAGPGRGTGRYLPAVRRSGRIATRYGSTTALLEPAPVPVTHSWHHRARSLCGHKYGHPDFVIILSIARYFSHIDASTERKRSTMDIIYTDEKRFTEQQVEHLFLSVGCPANIPIGRIGP